MPIGVPRVAFRIPGDEEATWVDIYSRLYRERTLFLAQMINSQIAGNIISLMIYLSIEEPTRDLFLFINSPGGGIISGLGIFDTMQFVTPAVSTICMGYAVSMASFILVGGEVTERLAFPHARVMIHQPATSFYKDKVDNYLLEGDELKKFKESLAQVYVQRTGTPYSIMRTALERDTFMSATEAQALGIVDSIGG
uniref:ATP-dependent Clp protease proteolytic subunit n=1 Tax=Circaeaster agrestis TaxID=39288 RepID=A0A6M8PJS7_9MAGN|nr:clp protease proteolytic subunit [Circaeaster agrestis]